MDTGSDCLYEAFLSRDPRFDGRFFVGVVTTGIYCRPVCPAPSPRKKNVRFFACAAAAEEAGFRPCRRCRPETSPGTPAWLGTSATVSRALRLISQGALDEGSVAGLADRLGVGERHLRRLFARHLGASPVAVAQTRRVHFARALIDQTDLTLSEIAFAAGFGSLRRFNELMRRVFRDPPRVLRDRTSGDPGSAVEGYPSTAHIRRDMEGAVDLRLPYRPPYHWDQVVRYLSARAIPGVEVVDADSYRRSVEVDGHPGIVEVWPERGRPFLRMRVVTPVRRDLIAMVERVRRIFDLDADPEPISGHLSRDRALRRAVKRRPGLRVPGAWDGFELAVRAILGQQVTVKAATTMCGRLVERWGSPLTGTGAQGPRFLFPTPEVLARADLPQVGITRQRALAIGELARCVSRQEISLAGGEMIEKTQARLGEIPGVGEWTASYIALRALGEPDAFPAGDLGLRRSMARGGKLPTPRELVARAESWRPWRAYAAMHLWMRRE